MRIAVVTEMGAWSACTRYRALQHIPRLQALLDAEVDVLLPHDVVPRHDFPLERPVYFARHSVRYLRRGLELFRTLRSYDALFVQRGVYPMGPGTVARLLERFDGRLVYDIDDAVFLTSPSLAAKARTTRWLYGSGQAQRLLRRADAVVVSTPELAASLPAGVCAAAVLPTVPDVDTYPQARHEPRAPVRIGWVGTSGNLLYLDPFAGVFARLAEEGIAELEVVCSEPWQGPASFRPWTLAEERDVFARYDIGIMPLTDSPFTRAKAGFKLLQSLAAGVPVVASPVGTNRRLLADSHGGLVASTPVEWEQALRTLAADVALRAELGARGRDFVRGYAQLDVQAATLAALLRP